jgi:hypothetical protein
MHEAELLYTVDSLSRSWSNLSIHPVSGDVLQMSIAVVAAVVVCKDRAPRVSSQHQEETTFPLILCYHITLCSLTLRVPLGTSKAQEMSTGPASLPPSIVARFQSSFGLAGLSRSTTTAMTRRTGKT